MTKPGVVLVYRRQSASDFDKDGKPKGPSLDQQLDSVVKSPALQGMTFEPFTDANLSGKEISRRAGYNAMMTRLRNAAKGEVVAVACYDADRLHRNVVEFYGFMTEMDQRGIVVYEAAGPIRNEDELSWGVKAVVASAERKKTARRVRDNAQFMKKQGNLLGPLPVGYQRQDGKVVTDPVATPIIQQVFGLYESGRYSFASLATHLNSIGVTPPHGSAPPIGKRQHPEIFTAGSVQAVLRNVSYTGQVLLANGQLIPGQHPRLVSDDTFAACQRIRSRNWRKLTHVFRRHPHSLSQLLRCSDCGGNMRGEVGRAGGTGPQKFHYVCANRRRHRCTARRIPAPDLEVAVANELRAGLTDAAFLSALRKPRAPSPQRVTVAELKRIDNEIARVNSMYRRAEGDEDIIGQDEWFRTVTNLKAEKTQLREAASARKPEPDLNWCEQALRNALATWETAMTGTASGRAGMLAELFAHIEVAKAGDGRITAIAVPQATWWPYFERLVQERTLRRGVIGPVQICRRVRYML
jgi:DNA invertase Pin-like site-specific DNA recombinase